MSPLPLWSQRQSQVLVQSSAVTLDQHASPTKSKQSRLKSSRSVERSSHLALVIIQRVRRTTAARFGVSWYVVVHWLCASWYFTKSAVWSILSPGLFVNLKIARSWAYCFDSWGSVESTVSTRARHSAWCWLYRRLVVCQWPGRLCYTGHLCSSELTSLVTMS